MENWRSNEIVSRKWLEDGDENEDGKQLRVCLGNVAWRWRREVAISSFWEDGVKTKVLRRWCANECWRVWERKLVCRWRVKGMGKWVSLASAGAVKRDEMFAEVEGLVCKWMVKGMGKYVVFEFLNFFLCWLGEIEQTSSSLWREIRDAYYVCIALLFI